MRADQKVSEQPTWTNRALAVAPLRVTLEGFPGRAPHRFVNRPFDINSRVTKKLINECFGPPWKRQQLGEDHSADNQSAARQRRVQRGLRDGIQGIIPIPERNENVRLDSGDHLLRKLCPRRSLRALIIRFRPDASPGLPMPRYFAKTLF